MADEVSFREFPDFGENDSFPKFMKGSRQTYGSKEKQSKEFYVSKAGDHGIERVGEELDRFVDRHMVLDHDMAATAACHFCV